MHAITIILLVVTASSAAQQQDSVRPRIGLVAHASLDLHSASFSQLPDIGNCCPEYTGGIGNGMLVGISYLSPLNDDWYLDVRGGYHSGSVEMIESESRLIVQPSGLFESSVIRHNLSATIHRLTFEPLAVYKLKHNIGLRMGVYSAYQMSGDYLQSEVLETPTNAVFENGSRTRNQSEGSIDGIASANVGLTVGIGAEFPLDVDRVLTVSPELLVTYSPMTLVEGISWSKSMVRAGVVVSYSPIEEEEEITDLELFEVARTSLLRPRTEQRSVAVPTVSISGLSESGLPIDRSSIRVEEFASSRIRPVLPYLFFDEDSYNLPTRYRQLSNEQVNDYSLDNFYNLDAMITYYQVLNIVGKRLQLNSDAVITLTGCTDAREATSSEDLGKRRAQVVKNYLVDTWGVDPSRIMIEGRGLPSAASSESESDGAAENRRVEISCSNPSILSAVQSTDTMRVFDPPAIRFRLAVTDSSRVKTWTLFVSESDRIIGTFHGSGLPPSSIDWRIAEQARLIPRGTRNLEYMLVVQDSSGDVVPSESNTFAVTERTLVDKATSGATDKTVDRYSLILFGFDRSDLTDEHRSLIENVKPRIAPTSSVSVIGYTDRSGAEEYNKKLSEQRARSVASSLGTTRVEILGQGELLPLYDNETPEGRFYSRTVEVIVETPRR